MVDRRAAFVVDARYLGALNVARENFAERLFDLAQAQYLPAEMYSTSSSKRALSSTG